MDKLKFFYVINLSKTINNIKKISTKKYIPYKKSKPKNKISTSLISKNDYIIFIIISAIIFIGSILGSIYGINTETTSDILKNNNVSIYSDNSFITYFLKHSKYIFALWICGFFECGWGFNITILIFKSFTIGNIYSKIIYFEKTKGILYTLTSIIPNVFLITALIATSFFSFKMVTLSLTTPKGKMNLKREKYKVYAEYTIILITSLICIFIYSLLEKYIIGMLF